MLRFLGCVSSASYTLVTWMFKCPEQPLVFVMCQSPLGGHWCAGPPRGAPVPGPGDRAQRRTLGSGSSWCIKGKCPRKSESRTVTLPCPRQTTVPSLCWASLSAEGTRYLTGMSGKIKFKSLNVWGKRTCNWNARLSRRCWKDPAQVSTLFADDPADRACLGAPLTLNLLTELQTR